MVQDEMIMVAIEEMAKELSEIKKSLSQDNQNLEMDLTPIDDKIETLGKQINSYKDTVNHYREDIRSVTKSINTVENIIKLEKKSVEHRFIEIKYPHRWIMSIIAYVLISFTWCIIFFQSNQSIKADNKQYKANDMKYRFIKLRADKTSDILQVAKTSDQWLYYIDDYYKKNQKEVETFVLNKEEAIRKEIEAREIANQKANEARIATEKANKLKQKASSINKN